MTLFYREVPLNLTFYFCILPLDLQNAINVILSPPPDLRVVSLQMEDSFSTGDDMHVKWQVDNDGDAPYKQTWFDRVVSIIGRSNYKHNPLSIIVSTAKAISLWLVNWIASDMCAKRRIKSVTKNKPIQIY